MGILKDLPPAQPVGFIWPDSDPRRYTLVDGEPKPGFEAEYRRAWRHRAIWPTLYDRTPWWQPRKRARRLKGWLRAINDVHRFGQDVTVTRVSRYEHPEWGKR
jgi:hypothetical protein